MWFMFPLFSSFSFFEKKATYCRTRRLSECLLWGTTGCPNGVIFRNSTCKLQIYATDGLFFANIYLNKNKSVTHIDELSAPRYIMPMSVSSCQHCDEQQFQILPYVHYTVVSVIES